VLATSPSVLMRRLSSGRVNVTSAGAGYVAAGAGAGADDKSTEAQTHVAGAVYETV
jgi:hypothetical protein